VALMQLAGLGVKDVLGVVREARDAAGFAAPVVVTGVLAAELARALGGGAAPGAVVVGGEPGEAAALLVVLGGTPTEADDQAMRRAARRSVPVIAVQTDPRADVTLPYVPAADVVVCPAGAGFPVDEIGRVLVSRLGQRAVPLGARVPALREHVVRELIRKASLQAGVVGALPWRKGADYPALTLLQGRLVLDLAAAHGRHVDRERAPELAVVAGTGLGARALVRRLPRRIPLVGGVAAYLTTRALGKAAAARFTASG
jgi:uncharacterized protein (DUF697 family)